MIRLLLYPFLTSYRILKSPEKTYLKVFKAYVVLFILVPVWALGISIIVAGGKVFTYQMAERVGLIGAPVHISGTGSMYPTFPKGDEPNQISLANQSVATPAMRRYPGVLKILNKEYFAHSLQRGDIISFENNKTLEISQKETGYSRGFVKRVIGLPGEAVEIRDGYVWLDNQQLDEPYTAAARSTFGGETVADCRQITVPPGKVFVLGDNRKGSNDSRHDLGLVDFQDIDRVLPIKWQTEYQSLWRDTTHDRDTANLPLLNQQKYLETLNQKRQEAKLPPLRFQPKLLETAKKRAEVILRTGDLSFEASQSGYPMDRAMSEVGYSNIVWGEAPTLGYYTEEELIENFFQFSEWKQFLLNKDFQETGVIVKVGELNGCPVQLVVQHFAGYVPPNYKPEDIRSWETGLENLKQIQPGWEALKEYPEYYVTHRNEIDQITRLLQQRITAITAIVNRMKINQWLTPEEKNMAEQDQELTKELNELIQRLNGQE